MNTSSYDLVVIGGGPAGTSGALTAAAFGKRVALVELTGVLGGAGINTGTIPSKTLRESALLLSGWRTRKLLGLVVAQRNEAKLPDFTHHEQQVIESFYDFGFVVNAFHQNHLVVDGNTGVGNFYAGLVRFGRTLDRMIKMGVHVERFMLFDDADKIID